MKRIAFIYDHLIHRKKFNELIDEYKINYSTMRHVLAQYYIFGRTNIRKYKIKYSESNQKKQTCKDAGDCSALKKK